MRRVLVLALALVLAGLLMPGEVHAQGGACYGLPESGREYAAWSGPWVGHGRDIEIFPQGCGILTWRTYQQCAPGQAQTIARCDPVIDGVIHHGNVEQFWLDTKDGAAASGHFRMFAPQYSSVRRDGIVLRLNDDSTLTVEWDDMPTDFCREWAYSIERCGA